MTEFKEVLVTGGLGFIGSSIATEFAAHSARVTIVDSLLSNVADGREFAGGIADVRTCSVEEYLGEVGTLADFDLVVHSASYVGPAGVLKHGGRMAPDMLAVTSALAESCIESSTPLLFISSSEVYGVDGTLREDMTTRVPPEFNARIEYALAKITSEAVLNNCHSRGLRSVSIRPFNVIGARQSRLGGFVVPTFVQQALAGKPLTVFESGEQKRAFVSVDDLARFVVVYLRHDNFGCNERVNIGNPDNICTINELAERVIALVGSKSTITHVDPRTVYGPLYREAASQVKICDISKARDLGWSPRKSLDEIIVEVAEYFRTNRDIRNSDVRDQ
jgi:nucleoside-diphosphate-sugar epimerase